MGGVYCEICKINCNNTKLLEKHKNNCSKPSFENYEQKCEICLKLFSCPSSLKYHIKTQHYQQTKVVDPVRINKKEKENDILKIFFVNLKI